MNKHPNNPYDPSRIKFPVEFVFSNDDHGSAHVTFHGPYNASILCAGVHRCGLQATHVSLNALEVSAESAFELLNKEIARAFPSDQETPTEGKTFVIKLNGLTDMDIEDAADEALKLIKAGNTSGFNSNGDGSFSFESTGEYPEYKLVRADSLAHGDLIDLEGDKYAEADGPLLESTFECAHVLGVTRESETCVLIETDMGSFGCPPDHMLRKSLTATWELR